MLKLRKKLTVAKMEWNTGESGAIIKGDLRLQISDSYTHRPIRLTAVSLEE